MNDKCVNPEVYSSYRKEVEVIKDSIRQVLGWCLEKNGKEWLSSRLSETAKFGSPENDFRNIEATAFPTFVETCIFFSYRNRKPVVMTTGWADQPRVTFFRVAWNELGLPEYPLSPFHLMLTKQEVKK